tara:strand:- start:193 stop:519 length:327 start_codon:yes stop_codon:yes gene_type:complete
MTHHRTRRIEWLAASAIATARDDAQSAAVSRKPHETQCLMRVQHWNDSDGCLSLGVNALDIPTETNQPMNMGNGMLIVDPSVYRQLTIKGKRVLHQIGHAKEMNKPPF